MRYRWTFERKLTSTEVFQTGRKGSLISAGHDSSHRRRLSNNHKFTNHFLTSILVLRKKTPTNLIDNTQSFHYGAHDVPSKSFGCQLIATDIGHLVFMLHQRLWVVAFTTFVPIYGGDSIGRESQPTHPRTTPSSPGTGAETCKREKPNRRKKEAVVQSLAGPPNLFESGRKHFYWSAGKRRGDTRDVTLMTSHHRWKIPYIVFPRNENSIGNFSSLSLPEARLGLSVKVNHIRQCYFCFRFWFTNRIFLPLLSFGESETSNLELYGSLIAVTKLGECPTHARGKCQKLAQQFLSISMTTLSAEMAVCIRDILSNSELVAGYLWRSKFQGTFTHTWWVTGLVKVQY